MNSICYSLKLPNAFNRGVQEDHKWQHLLVHIVYSLSQLNVESRPGTLMLQLLWHSQMKTKKTAVNSPAMSFI